MAARGLLLRPRSQAPGGGKGIRCPHVHDVWAGANRSRIGEAETKPHQFLPHNTSGSMGIHQQINFWGIGWGMSNPVAPPKTMVRGVEGITDAVEEVNVVAKRGDTV
jgi:hypothetical protein